MPNKLKKNKTKNQKISIKTRTKGLFSKIGKSLINFTKKYSVALVILICALLMGLIIAGDEIRNRNNIVVEPTYKAKKVNVFRIGESARIDVLGNIKKDNVVHIHAQTAGVVQKIYVKEGQEVNRGKYLAYLSSNYQGGSAQTVQRQIAQKSYQNVVDTFDQQNETIDKQIELAKQVDSNSDELRKISENSIDGVKNQINFNSELLKNVEDSLDDLEQATPSADVNSLILSTKSMKSQLLAAGSQLQSSLDNLEYSTNTDSPPSKMSVLQKDIAIKQLELAKKSLELNKEISHLQLKLAYISESLAYPASFLKGTVQKVHVQAGDTVSPGQILFTVSGEAESVKIEALVNQSVADNYSQLEPSYIRIGDDLIEAIPTFISTESTNGTLHTISFLLDGEQANKLTDNSVVTISLPVGYPDSAATMPLVPIDSITQTNTGDFLYVVENNLAKARQVELGSLFGQFVIINEGLVDGDQIILDKSVLDGDKIEVSINE